MKSILIVKPQAIHNPEEPMTVGNLKRHYYQVALGVDLVAVELNEGFRVLKHKDGVKPNGVVSRNFLMQLLRA